MVIISALTIFSARIAWLLQERQLVSEHLAMAADLNMSDTH